MSFVPVCIEKGFATLPVNATQAVATVAVRTWFGSHAWVTDGPAGNKLSVIFRWSNSFWGFPVIRASTHARQIIQSFLPARPKKKKKRKKKSGRAECKWEDSAFHELSLAFERTHRSKKDFLRERERGKEKEKEKKILFFLIFILFF